MSKLTREDVINLEAMAAHLRYVDMLAESCDEPSRDGIRELIMNGDCETAKQWAEENKEEYQNIIGEIVARAHQFFQV